MKTAILNLPLLLAFVTLTNAQERPAARGRAAEKGETYIDPAKAGPDFAVQGEYVGELAGGKGKIGVDVIALGDDKFQAVFFAGGLPGDGWDGKSRTEVQGNREGEKTTFAGAYDATIENGSMTGKSEAGDSFSLKRVTRVSPTQGAKAPAGAVVLFDGTNTGAWENGKMDERHLLESGTKTKKKYQDFTLHVEFLLPFKPFARDQERGNSGIYIQDRYEMQILDTFGHKPEFNGMGSTYRQTAPLINMCYPPLQWQTYDIDFTAAKFDSSGRKTRNAVVTARVNGVLVQDHTELTNKTGAGKPEGPEAGPIQLQGHNNPVFFRNIWVIEKQ
ncbi:MAG TPA: DUF1080 domain-containing protein [Bryobacteraceae bacterium]|nr:DUF1080 domain-containing protein [Bryobacteraceae bacterium]